MAQLWRIFFFNKGGVFTRVSLCSPLEPRPANDPAMTLYTYLSYRELKVLGSKWFRHILQRRLHLSISHDSIAQCTQGIVILATKCTYDAALLTNRPFDGKNIPPAWNTKHCRRSHFVIRLARASCVIYSERLVNATCFCYRCVVEYFSRIIWTTRTNSSCFSFYRV